MTSIFVGGGLGLVDSSLTQTNGFGGKGAARIGQGSDGAQVDAATGNLVLQGADQFVSAVGLGDVLTRTYNSLGRVDGDNNDGWRISVYRNLGIGGGTTPITRTSGDGHEAVFTYDAALGAWQDTSEGSGAYDTIKLVNNQYVYAQGGSNLSETYDSSGRLLSEQDGNGNTLTYHYTGSLITSITDSSGQTTALEYSGNNLTDIKVTGYAAGAASGSPAQAIITVRYAYDSANRLSQVQVDLTPGTDNSVADGKVYTTTYQYDGNSDRVTHVAQSDGSSLSINYVEVDGSYRVLTLTDGDGQTTSFHYDTAAGLTTVTDPLGNATAYAYDAQGRLSQVTQPAVQGATASISYSYDADGNISQVTDAAGRVVRYTYTDGSLTRTQDALGNTIDRTYDALGNLLSETTYTTPAPANFAAGNPAGAQTAYSVYDAGHNLVYTVSPTGNVTQYRYDSHGERISTVRYLGGVYTTSSQPTQAQLDSWTAAQGSGNTQRTDSTYDLSGQILTVTTYTGPGATGTAVATHYVYDTNGRLLLKADGRASTIAAGQPDVTSYLYDGLGRLLATQDGAGLQTVYGYDDAHNTVATTTAGGLTTTRVYDAEGHLTSVSRTGSGVVSGTTTYVYDADGRQVMATDPTGARTFYIYDERGRQVGVVSPQGELTETVYNDDDQVIRTVQYNGTVDTSTLVDGSGKPFPLTLTELRGGTAADAPPAVDLDGSDATLLSLIHI